MIKFAFLLSRCLFDGYAVVLYILRQKMSQFITTCSDCKVSLHSTTQGPAHCSTLHFGLGPSDPVVGFSGSELEVDVEYTFRLTVSKEGMTPESTTQTVRAIANSLYFISLSSHIKCWTFKKNSIFFKCYPQSSLRIH